MTRRPLIALLIAGAALAVPAAASAEVIEVGSVPPFSPSSCPTRPCLAVSRTTGYQAKVGATRSVMTIPKTGRIVAWSIGLGDPGAQQTAFFNERLGGEAEAQLTIINPRAKLRARVVAEGAAQKLQPYFGSSPQFPLARSIRVQQGLGRGADGADLGARARGRPRRGHVVAREPRAAATATTRRPQTSQLTVNQLAQYFCLYRTARLNYTATLISDPVQPAAG